jgi:hypothetical protein
VGQKFEGKTIDWRSRNATLFKDCRFTALIECGKRMFYSSPVPELKHRDRLGETFPNRLENELHLADSMNCKSGNIRSLFTRAGEQLKGTAVCAVEWVIDLIQYDVKSPSRIVKFVHEMRKETAIEALRKIHSVTERHRFVILKLIHKECCLTDARRILDAIQKSTPPSWP